MGDYAWAGITFYEVPDADRQAVFDFLEEHFSGPGSGFGYQPFEDLTLGEQYTVDEHSLGFCSEDVAALVDEHPGVSVRAYQASRYEFNGEILMHAPDLGTFLGETDNDGGIVVDENIIAVVYDKLPEGVDAGYFKRRLDEATGQPWLARFDPLDEVFRDMAHKPTLERPSEEDEGEDEGRGITFTRAQVEAWVGHALTDDQIEELEEALPNSSLPQCVEAVAHEGLGFDDFRNI